MRSLGVISSSEAWASDGLELYRLTSDGQVASERPTCLELDGGDTDCTSVDALSGGSDGELWWAGGDDTGGTRFVRRLPDAGTSRWAGGRVFSIAVAPGGDRLLLPGWNQILRCDALGLCHEDSVPGAETNLQALAVAPDGGVVAVSQSGGVFRSAENGWTPLLVDHYQLNGLVPLADGGLLAVGATGAILRRVDGGWEELARTEGAVFAYEGQRFAGWENPSGSVYIAGRDPQLIRFDPSTGSAEPQRLIGLDGGVLDEVALTWLTSVHGRGDTVYAVGSQDGTAQAFRKHADGDWHQVLQLGGDLRAVSVGQDGAAIAVGNGGLIVRMIGDAFTTIQGPTSWPSGDWAAVLAETRNRFLVTGADSRVWAYESGAWSSFQLTSTGADDSNGASLAAGTKDDLWQGRRHGLLVHLSRSGAVLHWYDLGTQRSITDVAVANGRVFVTVGEYSGPCGGGIISLPTPP